jgi:hypothetical protein
VLNVRFVARDPQATLAASTGLPMMRRMFIAGQLIS